MGLVDYMIDHQMCLIANKCPLGNCRQAYKVVDGVAFADMGHRYSECSRLNEHLGLEGSKVKGEIKE